MALMPSDLELWIDTDDNDTTKGSLKLGTIDDYPSLDYEILYGLAEDASPDYDGQLTITLTGVQAPQGPAGAMMAPAVGEIPYEIMDCGCLGCGTCTMLENGTLKIIRGREYLIILSEQGSAPLGDLHYKLTVTDDEVEIEPLLSIF